MNVTFISLVDTWSVKCIFHDWQSNENKDFLFIVNKFEG